MEVGNASVSAQRQVQANKGRVVLTESTDIMRTGYAIDVDSSILTPKWYEYDLYPHFRHSSEPWVEGYPNIQTYPIRNYPKGIITLSSKPSEPQMEYK